MKTVARTLCVTCNILTISVGKSP